MDSKKLIRNLSQKSNILVPFIDAYQAGGNFPNKWHIVIENYKEDDGCFHPSSDCLTPSRELYESFVNPTKPKPISHLLRRTFDCGTLWHGYFENILIEMGFVDPDDVERHYIKEIQSKDGTAKAAGTGDLVNVNIPGHGKWLVDLKTMNKRQFETPDKYLMDKYTAQVNIYSDFFQLDNIMILGICKDSPHALKEIIIRKDEELIDLIYGKWIHVSNCIKNGSFIED